MVTRRFFAFLLATGLSLTAHARPQISVQVDPSVVQNGESVTFSIDILSTSDIQVSDPLAPNLTDWEIVAQTHGQDLNSRITQGQIVTTWRHVFSYVLQPRRVGKLQIPSFKVPVDSKLYSTTPLDVDVENLQGNSQPSTGSSGLAPTEEEEDMFALPPNPNLFGNLDSYPVPERETVFLRAETSKTTVYEGELIVLSFALYQKNVDLSSAELDKFPDFKGFLKEDLFIPKTWNRQQVMMKGERYFRTELIRYALFSLKPGEEKIGQLVFRAEVQNTMSSILGSIMAGRPLGNLGQNAIPIIKTNPAVTIRSKALPPIPPTANQFTGAIGQFALELKVPSTNVVAEQPFSIELKLKGRGNLKTIEAPALHLPPDFEVVDTKSLYKFNEDATGFKTFEYLVLPKKAGSFDFPPQMLSYFDPDKAQYLSLKTEGSQLTVTPSNTVATEKTKSGATEEKPSFGPLRSGPQNFIVLRPYSRGSWLVHPVFLIFQCFLYIGAFVWLLLRSRFNKREMYLLKHPWERTAYRMRGQKQWPLFQLADLIDLWLRERLCGLLNSSQLYSESHHDEFFYELRQKLDPERQQSLQALKEIWTELDLLRFSGSQKQNETMSYSDLFARAENVYAQIAKDFGGGGK